MNDKREMPYLNVIMYLQRPGCHRPALSKKLAEGGEAAREDLLSQAADNNRPRNAGQVPTSGSEEHASREAYRSMCWYVDRVTSMLSKTSMYRHSGGPLGPVVGRGGNRLQAHATNAVGQRTTETGCATSHHTYTASGIGVNDSTSRTSSLGEAASKYGCKSTQRSATMLATADTRFALTATHRRVMDGRHGQRRGGVVHP
jgi:hypothetical protein